MTEFTDIFETSDMSKLKLELKSNSESEEWSFKPILLLPELFNLIS